MQQQMQSMSPAVLGAVIFVAVMVIAYLLDMTGGPLAILIVSAVIVGLGYWRDREWMTYLGGLFVCAGITYDVILSSVQAGSIFGGIFGILMLGSVAVCATLSADKMQSGI